MPGPAEAGPVHGGSELTHMTRRRSPKTTLQGTLRGGRCAHSDPLTSPQRLAPQGGGSHTPYESISNRGAGTRSCRTPAHFPSSCGFVPHPLQILNPPHTDPTACAQQVALSHLK